MGEQEEAGKEKGHEKSGILVCGEGRSGCVWYIGMRTLLRLAWGAFSGIANAGWLGRLTSTSASAAVQIVTGSTANGSAWERRSRA